MNIVSCSKEQFDEDFKFYITNNLSLEDLTVLINLSKK